MKYAALGIGTAVLTLLLVFAWPAAEKPLPPLTFKIIDGRTLALNELRDRPVLVNFWATTCGVCVEELPALMALYRDYAPRGLELIGVAMPYDPPSYVVAMQEQRAISYPVALDIDGTAMRAFEVAVTPTTLLLYNGRLVERTVGHTNMQRLRARIDELL